jgi:hypothetical protein
MILVPLSVGAKITNAQMSLIIRISCCRGSFCIAPTLRRGKAFGLGVVGHGRGQATGLPRSGRIVMDVESFRCPDATRHWCIHGHALPASTVDDILNVLGVGLRSTERRTVGGPGTRSCPYSDPAQIPPQTLSNP